MSVDREDAAQTAERPESFAGECALVAGLLLLLAANIGSAWLPLGNWHLSVNLAISATQAGLLFGFSMQLHRSGPMLRYLPSVALAVLTLLIALTIADVLTRQLPTAPW